MLKRFRFENQRVNGSPGAGLFHQAEQLTPDRFALLPGIIRAARENRAQIDRTGGWRRIPLTCGSCIAEIGHETSC
jgi:hypothetical protein